MEISFSAMTTTWQALSTGVRHILFW